MSGSKSSNFLKPRSEQYILEAAKQLINPPTPRKNIMKKHV